MYTDYRGVTIEREKTDQNNLATPTTPFTYNPLRHTQLRDQVIPSVINRECLNPLRVASFRAAHTERISIATCLATYQNTDTIHTGSGAD